MNRPSHLWGGELFTHRKGGWVDDRGDTNVSEKRKISCPGRE